MLYPSLSLIATIKSFVSFILNVTSLSIKKLFFSLKEKKNYFFLKYNNSIAC